MAGPITRSYSFKVSIDKMEAETSGKKIEGSKAISGQEGNIELLTF